MTHSPICTSSELPSGATGEIAAGFDLEQRDVGVLVAADEARRQLALVGEAHADVVGALDDVALVRM